MITPLVSIVIDNFNYAPYLAQSIDSALAQTHPHVEVIVVDDASTDGSRDVIAAYGDRVTTVMLAGNRGQGGAFNAGFRASQGEIIMFLDADDWLYPAAAARVVASWQPGQSKTHFRLDLVEASGLRIDTHPPPEVRLDRGDVVPLLLEYGRYETVVTSGNAFSRAALEANLPMPEEPFRIAADGFLATVVPFHGPVNCIEECLGAYRVHGANAFALGRRSDDLRQRMRRFLAHDARKVAVLRAKVAALGLALRKAPELKDPLHLERRLSSLRAGPGHPYPDDHRMGLALRGAVAARRAPLSWPRRALLAAWFLLVGGASDRTAVALICWKMLPTTRPTAVLRQLRFIRRLLG